MISLHNILYCLWTSDGNILFSRFSLHTRYRGFFLVMISEIPLQSARFLVPAEGIWHDFPPEREGLSRNRIASLEV